MFYHWNLFSRLAFYKKTRNTAPKYEPVSVVVCSHNAYEYLIEFVPAILSQDYPDFELVIVNDCSQDETTEYLKDLVMAHPEVNVVSIAQNLNFFHGKKFPLSMGIKSAKHDLLLLTDVECLPTNNRWIKEMVEAYRRNTEVVLGYGPYLKRKGLLNKIIRFDALCTAMQYFSMALAGKPYMGVGRNLSYRKSTFYGNKGFISHYRIASGDDDLFVSQVANRKNTEVCILATARMEAEPGKRLGTWVNQKRRQHSTDRFHKKSTKLVLWTLHSSRVLYYTSLILAFCLAPAFQLYVEGEAISLIYSYISMAMLPITLYATQLIIYTKSARRLREKELGLAFLPLYDFFFAAFGIFVKATSDFYNPKLR